MVMMRDPNWTGPGPGPMIDVPDTAQGNDVSSIADLYSTVGSRVSGSVQSYVDEIYAGAQSGKYSISDVQNALNIVNQQADQGMTGATPPSGGGGNDDGGASDFSPDPGAQATIKAGLAKYGLESLYSAVWGKYTKSEINLSDPEAFVFALKEEPAYKQRFAANEIRKARGLTELQPSTYISMEDTYRKTLQASGLPPGFYDTQADLDKMIGGDVSIFELSTRVQDAYNLVRDAPADVTEKLKSMYGISDGDILAYFIDPDRARPQLIAADYKREAQAAMVAAQAQRTAGIGLSKAFSEDVVRKGISEAVQKQAFTTIADMNELTRAQGTEKDLTAEQIAGAQLGIDSASRKILEDRKKGRIAGFSGGGDFSMQQTGGANKSGIGQAGI